VAYWPAAGFSPDPVSLNSDSPASAIPAIKQAADNNDRKAIPGW